MRNIVVPTDFSEQATAALEYAIDLGKKILANIHVVHVLEQPAYENFDTFADGYGGVVMDDIFTLKLIEKSKKSLLKLKEKYPEAQLETHMKMNHSIKDEIVSMTEKMEADFIVMGSKGTSTIGEDIVGSNAEKMVRNANCPVIIVKGKSSVKLENIVFASDFKDVKKRVVENIKLLQKTFNSKLHLLRVCTPHNFENTKIIHGRINEVAKKHELENYEIHTYNDFYEEDGISNFTSHNNYDLVCLATKGRKGLAHFFAGSIAENVVNHSYKPVMTFNLKMMEDE